MADVLLFVRHGWKNIWKQNIIWLFSLLTMLPTVGRLFQEIAIRQEANLLRSLLRLVGVCVSIVLYYVGLIGVPYLAYRFSIGEQGTIQETLLAAKKFSGRVLGLSCLVLLVFSPLLFLALILSIKNLTTPPYQISNTVILASMLLGIFSAMWHFSLAGFFAKDSDIRRSIKEAWSLLINHFAVLATLGVLLAIIFRVCYATLGVLSVLIQSGFDLVALSSLNLVNPATSLSHDSLFQWMSSAFQIIYVPFSVSAFMLAYLKYNGVKIQSLARES